LLVSDREVDSENIILKNVRRKKTAIF